MPERRARGDVARRRIALGDVRVHYRVAGRGKRGVPVVCLAPPGDSSGALMPLVQALGQSRLTFALDLPGQGRSSNPPYGRRDPSAWLLAWMQRMRFEHCHMVTVGGSLGVALDAVRSTPGPFASLTTIAPPPLQRPSRLAGAAHALADLPGEARSPRVVTGLAARARSRAAADFHRAMFPRDLYDELSHLTVPLVVVRGEHDHSTTHEDAATLARRAHGTFIDLPDAPRACHRTNAGDIAGMLERYWLSIDEGADLPARDGADALRTEGSE